MKKIKKVLLAICIFIVAVAAVIFAMPEKVHDTNYHAGEPDMTRNRRISASEARELMTRYPNAIVLDVRSEREFALGHIPGAISLPDFDIKYMAKEILCDYDALVLVYCQSGNRSRSATSLLLSMGFTNVYDFGGISSWPYKLYSDFS